MRGYHPELAATMALGSLAVDKIWRCPDCDAVNVDRANLTTWTCARCGQVWQRTVQREEGIEQ